MKKKISLSQIYLLAGLKYSDFCSEIAKQLGDIPQSADSSDFIKRCYLTYDLPPKIDTK